MGIVAAIARVRAGAKSAGLEGALNSLGAELKSDAIPGRLRDVAGRLAALLDRNQGAGQRSTQVASLEHALDQAALRSAQQHVAQHAAGGSAEAVCPFTGLRADELGVDVAPAKASASSDASQQAQPELAPSAPVQAESPAAPMAKAPVAVSDSAPAREEVPPAQQEAAAATPPKAERAAEAQSSGSGKRRRAGADAGNHEKRKERLAGSSPVANTSGRSATRPAAKRPRSRAESTRKKT